MTRRIALVAKETPIRSTLKRTVLIRFVGRQRRRLVLFFVALPFILLVIWILLGFLFGFFFVLLILIAVVLVNIDVGFRILLRGPLQRFKSSIEHERSLGPYIINRRHSPSVFYCIFLDFRFLFLRSSGFQCLPHSLFLTPIHI